jgi:hypothetical protein
MKYLTSAFFAASLFAQQCPTTCPAFIPSGGAGCILVGAGTLYCPISSVFAYVQGGPQNQAPPFTIAFSASITQPGAITACANLGTVNVPANAVPGMSIYLGCNPANPSWPLHVSVPGIGNDGNPVTVGCTDCYQDIFASPSPGEFQVGICTIGVGCQSAWTGQAWFPMPAVVVTGAGPGVVLANGCLTTQTQAQIVIDCS